MKCCKSTLFLTGYVLVFADDDLSNDKVATQSTTYPHGSNPPDTYVAGNAVDRDITTCMRTNPIGENCDDKTVWWKVDLGEVYSIYSVNILFKNYPGYDRRQQGRFAGFSIYVSSNGTRDNASLCYKDGPKLPALNFTTPCITSGRYVTFYNERLHDVTYPDGYGVNSVYTDLCEATVRGCQASGVYGNSCKERCPINCRDNVCHIQRGTCFGCDPGWIDTTCNTQCVGGWYGLDCQQQCSGHCRDNAVCNHVTGHCDMGCAVGWRGALCDKVCDNGTYGANCINNCSDNCLNDSSCNRQTGHCEGGCKPGYTNALCNEHCRTGYYGYRCEKACSIHCLNNTVCDYIDGRCSLGCQPGYIGKLCNTSCKNGYYGQNCSRVCSSNCKTCKPTDGTCSCYAGWMGPTCSTACNKSYGENCQSPCSPHCINQTCDRYNGTCLTSCKDKFYGDKCSAEIRKEHIGQVSNIIPAAIGGTVGACIIVIVSAVLVLIWRKRSFMSGTTGSHYAEVEIRQSKDSTYQQLNTSGQGTDNTNQQQNVSTLEPDNNYQQLNVSEIEPGNTYQQLNASRLETEDSNRQQSIAGRGPDNTYQQLNVSELEPGNTYQELNISCNA